MSDWVDVNGRTTYPERYHCVHFLENALRKLRVDVTFARDERTEGCYGLIINDAVMVWLIDNRLPHEAADEDPAAERLLSRGAKVFCAQKEDAERVGGYWLPIAATPQYRPPPNSTLVNKLYDAGFVGYVRDQRRADALSHLHGNIVLHHAAHVFHDAANNVYWNSHVGLNIPTLYGDAVAYDINMRVFEIPATRSVLVTNHLPTLTQIGFIPGTNCLTYRTISEVPACISWVKTNDARAEAMAAAGYALIQSRHTYAHRAREVMGLLSNR